MAAKLLDETSADGRERAEAAIRGYVLRGLGRVGAPFRVLVRRLWDNHYRVNVYAGSEEGPSATIAHSYFLVADADGNVLESTPKLPTPGRAAGEPRGQRVG